jgi:hypothetical protein
MRTYVVTLGTTTERRAETALGAPLTEACATLTGTT